MQWNFTGYLYTLWLSVSIILCSLRRCGSGTAGPGPDVSSKLHNFPFRPCSLAALLTHAHIKNKNFYMCLYRVKLSDNRGYSYVWSPCTGYSQCGNPQNDPDCAVCQHADQYYNLGHASNPVYLFNYHFDSFVYQIQYLWGVEWRWG